MLMPILPGYHIESILSLLSTYHTPDIASKAYFCQNFSASKLQLQIALSELEDGFTAFSNPSRELLPLRHLSIDLHKNGLLSVPLYAEFPIKKRCP